MKGLFKFLFWLGVFACIAYALASWLLFEYVEINNDYMVPTLAQGDFFVIYKRAEPDVGDVVVCTHPNHPAGPLAARIVAKAGQRVALRRGMLVVDGRMLDTDVPSPDRFHLVDRTRNEEMDLVRRREYLGDDVWTVSYKETRQPLEMAERRVQTGWFLLADNRSYGYDSRNFGEFDPSMCRGKAVFLLTTGEGNGDLDAVASERRFSPIH